MGSDMECKCLAMYSCKGNLHVMNQSGRGGGWDFNYPNYAYTAHLVLGVEYVLMSSTMPEAIYPKDYNIFCQCV